MIYLRKSVTAEYREFVIVFGQSTAIGRGNESESDTTKDIGKVYVVVD